jgi:hypothetical protein
MFTILGFLVLCFVIPAVVYPSLFTRPQPPNIPPRRTAAQLEEQKRLDELVCKNAREERKRLYY